MSVPRDEAAERAVLGAVLLSDVVIAKLVVDVHLTAEAFYDRRLGQVWDAMVGLHTEGDRVDVVALAARLPKDVPAGLVADLAAEAPDAANVLAYGRRVVEVAEWRTVQRAAVMLAEATAAQDTERRAEAERLLAGAHVASADTFSPDALAQEVWRHLDGQRLKAWRTPYRKIDEALGGGLHEGKVTLLGGWSSDGKSALCDWMLLNAASQGAKVHLYINEMSPGSRARRIVSMLSGVGLGNIMNPERMGAEDYQRVVKVLPAIPFGITQINDWTAEDVARHIRFHHWDVCAVDLIHLLPFKDERELALISRSLNAAARTSGAHLLGLVHLNELRSTTGIPPAPTLRDIRASGMLKNDADNVLFIYRDRELDENDMPVRTDDATLMLEKCRDGYLTRLALRFDGAHVRFQEATHPELVAA